MDEYQNIFIDEEYPTFLDKYFETKTLSRLKNVTQFCGCDYTKLYNPRFLYTRFDHSKTVAYMTWHFSKDKKATLMALFHDVGTPCFAHCIDYVFGDYISQESSEESVARVLSRDSKLLEYLEMDGCTLKDFEDDKKYPILENSSPRLCTDRLDGVLHTAYIWVATHELEDIENVFNDLVVLKNEDGLDEIGFKTEDAALSFAKMVYIYSTELQGNRSKYTSMFVAELVKLSFQKGLLSKNDLYTKREDELISIFEKNFISWEKFTKAKKVCSTKTLPAKFYIHYETKKRNVIPLVETPSGPKRLDVISKRALDIYEKFERFKELPYSFVEEIDFLE